MIETNIRRVFIYEFSATYDREILSYLAKTPMTRDWYFALMDYGSSLPKEINRRSAQYTKQSKFEGSNRQIRGGIIQVLRRQKTARPQTLAKLLDFPLRRITMNLDNLAKEGFVASRNNAYRLA